MFGEVDFVHSVCAAEAAYSVFIIIVAKNLSIFSSVSKNCSWICIFLRAFFVLKLQELEKFTSKGK